MFIQMYEEKFMRFPQGVAKAATFSYDDGVRADIRLLEIFRKYGLKGTFNLNSRLFDAACWHGRLDEEQTYRLFVDCGQEVANHGARHIFLDKVPLAEAIKEIVDCRAYLERRFARQVRGLAFAYGACPDPLARVLPDLGIDYARTTVSTRSFALPEDFLRWNPTCKHTDGQLPELTEKFLGGSPLDQPKHREPWLFFVWGHSFEFDDDDNWEVVETLGEKLSGGKDIWFASNGEICDYVNAYRALRYSIDGETAFNPSAIPVWVEVRGKTYRVGAGETTVFEKP